MNEDEEPNAVAYEDGTLANEIERLLHSRLHRLNTIEEIEFLKVKIHAMMTDAFSVGQSRVNKTDSSSWRNDGAGWLPPAPT